MPTIVDAASLESLIGTCRRIAESVVPDLNRCANLAVAGTGSESLVTALWTIASKTSRDDTLYRYPLSEGDLESLREWRIKMPHWINSSAPTLAARWSRAVVQGPDLVAALPFVLHRHYRRASGFKQLWTTSEAKGSAKVGSLPSHHGSPSCLVTTVREPSARFESGFRSSFGNPAVRRKQFGGHHSATAFVEALRSRDPHTTRIFNQSFAEPTYQFASGGACCDDVAGGGSNFLTSQVDYLRGVDCTRLPLFFVCTESFDADLRRLVARGSAGGSSVAKQRRAWQLIGNRWRYAPMQLNFSNHAAGHARHARFGDGSAKSVQHRDLFVNSTSLASTDRAYLREHLYPLDVKLHDLVCGTKAQQRQR